MIKMIKIF